MSDANKRRRAQSQETRERTSLKIPRRKIKLLLERLDKSLLERKTHVRMALLSLLAGHHVLLLGPPGTAKSLLARALCQCVKGAAYFEYLLSKFTHPDELFGPVSIPGLKEEDYRRLTEGYLPQAHVGFLDEIFKANSAILNSLLTLINERVFHHGKHRDTAPLLGILGASNEPPDPEGGLGALYDRFLVRLAVPPVQDDESFLQVCLGELEVLEIPEDERLTLGEIERLRSATGGVKADKTIRSALVAIRKKLAEHEIDASDRRWRWALELVKMSAVSSGRDSLSPIDLTLLEYCFGDPGQNEAIVRKAVRDQLMYGVSQSGYLEPLEQVWDVMRADNDAMAGYHEALARRTAQLDEFDGFWQEASRTLDRQLDNVRQEAEQCPWVMEIPPELLAGFVSVRQAMETMSDQSHGYRKALAGEAPLARLMANLRSAKRRRRGYWNDNSKASVWVCDQDRRQPEHWIPINSDGESLWQDRDDCIRSIESGIKNYYRHRGELAPKGLSWTDFVRCVGLDDDWFHALHNDQYAQESMQKLLEQAEAHRRARAHRAIERDHPVFQQVMTSMSDTASAFAQLRESVVDTGEYRLPIPPVLLPQAEEVAEE